MKELNNDNNENESEHNEEIIKIIKQKSVIQICNFIIGKCTYPGNAQ